jgi:hypothetical protein
VRQIEVRAFEKVQQAVKQGLSKIEALPPPQARVTHEGAAAR